MGTLSWIIRVGPVNHRVYTGEEGGRREGVDEVM